MLLCWLVVALAIPLGVLAVRRAGARTLPAWSVAVALLSGAAVLPAAGMLEDRLARLGTALPSAGIVALVAGAVEESAKFLLALAIVVFLPPRRGARARGALLGCLAGLGLAVLEATTYHHRWLAAGWEFLPQQVPRLFAHLVLGGVAAQGARPRAFRSATTAARAAGWVVAAMAIHALVDWASLAPAVFERLPGAPNSVQAGLVFLATALCARALARGAGAPALDGTLPGEVVPPVDEEGPEVPRHADEQARGRQKEAESETGRS